MLIGCIGTFREEQRSGCFYVFSLTSAAYFHAKAALIKRL